MTHPVAKRFGARTTQILRGRREGEGNGRRLGLGLCVVRKCHAAFVGPVLQDHLLDFDYLLVGF